MPRCHPCALCLARLNISEVLGMGPWCSPFDKAEALVEFSLMPSLPANLPGTFHLPKRGSAFRTDLVPHLYIPGLHCLSSVLPVLCFKPILTVRHREYGSMGSAAQMLMNKCVCVCVSMQTCIRGHMSRVCIYILDLPVRCSTRIVV